MNSKLTLSLAATALLVGCAPRILPLARVMENGEIVDSRSAGVVERARVEGDVERDRLREQRGLAEATALASCSPEICDALARGQLALEMNEAQVLAATRTTRQAWATRDAAGVTLLTAHAPAAAPSDALGQVVRVALRNGRVTSFTYREPHGYRTVTSARDATVAGRAAAQAEMLLAQGDAYTAQGELDRALHLYDRADILRPEHPETTLRIARTLDKQLRPVEAVLQYRLFIHRMELERIDAQGEAAAKIAEAIARAHERIVVLERR